MHGTMQECCQNQGGTFFGLLQQCMPYSTGGYHTPSLQLYLKKHRKQQKALSTCVQHAAFLAGREDMAEAIGNVQLIQQGITVT